MGATGNSEGSESQDDGTSPLAADPTSAMVATGNVVGSKSMNHDVASLPEGRVHCAQIEDGSECIMLTMPIIASLSHHQCKGSCY